jgi:hypothetical protein
MIAPMPLFSDRAFACVIGATTVIGPLDASPIWSKPAVTRSSSESDSSSVFAAVSTVEPRLMRVPPVLGRMVVVPLPELSVPPPLYRSVVIVMAAPRLDSILPLLATPPLRGLPVPVTLIAPPLDRIEPIMVSITPEFPEPAADTLPVPITVTVAPTPVPALVIKPSFVTFTPILFVDAELPPPMPSTRTGPVLRPENWAHGGVGIT